MRARGLKARTHFFSPFLPGDRSTDYANFYQGLWDCTGALSDELSFKRGDVIYILSKVRRHPKTTATEGEHATPMVTPLDGNPGKRPLGILLGPC